MSCFVISERTPAGLVETVIVKDVSRVSRDSFELPEWVNNIRKKGVSFISVLDGLTDDTLIKIDNTFKQAFKDYYINQRKKPPYRKGSKIK